MRSIFIVFVLISLPLWAQDSSPAHDLLASAFAELKAKGWGSDDFSADLIKIVANYPDSPEAKTADTLMVPVLIQKGSLDDAMKLVETVGEESPNTWQSAFAQVNRVAILQGEGKRAESLQAAVQAIPAIEASSLYTVRDPDYFAFLNATGTRRSSFKDGILGLAATQLIQNGNIQQAMPFLNDIRDPKIKAQIMQGIQSSVAALGAPAVAATQAATSVANAASANQAVSSVTTAASSATASAATAFGTAAPAAASATASSAGAAAAPAAAAAK